MNVRPPFRRVVTWGMVLAGTTLALLPFRTRLDKAHVALVLLLVVLGAGAAGGRLLGLSVGAASFLVFDWFFLPPYNSLILANPLDWLVLVAFLAASVIASQLLHREQESARRAAARAAEVDRLVALLASVSHDLRTPLTTIKALAHDLGSLGDERSQVIEEQADRLNRFVADVLDLSRLSAGAMPMHLGLNAVDDLLSAALEETEARLDGRTLDVELSPDGELLVGTFDLSLSIRVLVNLIENAHKYSSPGTPVSVAARREGVRLLVSVTDLGPGIPPGEVERIFTPFYRPAGTPSDAGSTGLGLAIARRMAEAQRGTVSYAPRPLGGSIFTLALPAADLPLRSSAAERAKT